VAVANPVSPSEQDRKQIQELSHALAQVPAERTHLVIDLATKETLAVPRPVFEALKMVVEQMGRGRAVSIVPLGMMLTTQQAADILGSSRQHVVKLLEGEQIPYERVGTHRRIRIEDVVAYKQRRQSTREEALTRMSKQAERLGLRY
jgi:excisionase family DNA binding protein